MVSAPGFTLVVRMETARHRHLAGLGIKRATLDGAAITHAAGQPGYPRPRRVGRHIPDARGYTLTRDVRVEAKLGPELFNRHTQEQLRDFTRVRAADGRVPRLYLAVPAGRRDEAVRTVWEAGGVLARVTIVSPPIRVRRRRQRVRRMRGKSPGERLAKRSAWLATPSPPLRRLPAPGDPPGEFLRALLKPMRQASYGGPVRSGPPHRGFPR